MKKKEPNSLDLARKVAERLKSLEKSYKDQATDPKIQQTITQLTDALSKAIKDLQKENPIEAQSIAADALQEAQTRYQEDYTNPFGDATKRQQIKNLKKLSEETAKAAKTQQTTVQPNTQHPDQPNAPTTPGQQQPQGQGIAQTNATPNIQQTATQPAQASTQTIQPGQQPPQGQGVAQTNTTPNTQQTATQPTQATAQTTQQEQQQAQRAAERDASITAAQKANKENLANLQAAKEAKAERATQVSGAAKIIVDTKIKQNKIQADTEQREVMEQALQDALNVDLKLDPKEYYGIMSKAYNDNLIKRAGDKAQRQGKPRAIAEAAVRNKIREKNAAKGAIAQPNISYKKIKLNEDINRVTTEVAADFKQLKVGFTEANIKYKALNEVRENKVKEIQKALDDPSDPLFQKALNNVKLELLNKRNLGVKDINDPTKFTQKEWAKFNKEATSLAKKKLEGIKKQAELGNSGSWFDFSSSFNKLETAKGKLEDLSGRLAGITSNLNKLQGQINKAEQDKKALADLLGVESKYTTIQNFKVGVQKLRARFNARFNNDDEELKRIELFEGLVKKIDKYEKDFRETSKEFNKTKPEYNACKKDFDNRYAERNRHYHDKVVPALAKLDNAPSQELLTALQNKDTQYKLEQQQTQSKIDRIKESMTGDYIVGSTTAGSVVADTHKTAVPEKQNNGLGTPPN